MAVTSFTLRPRPGQRTQGHLIIGSRALSCAIGQAGLTSHKREGDGATPILTTRPLYGLYRADRERKPQSLLPFFTIQPQMGWCDDITDPNYNRPVRRPFAPSHEALWRDDALYDLLLVLDINITTRCRGRGSALFLHVARKGYSPTQGCLALSKPNLRWLLRHISPSTRLHIAC